MKDFIHKIARDNYFFNLPIEFNEKKNISKGILQSQCTRKLHPVIFSDIKYLETRRYLETRFICKPYKVQRVKGSKNLIDKSLNDSVFFKFV